MTPTGSPFALPGAMAPGTAAATAAAAYIPPVYAQTTSKGASNTRLDMVVV